MRISLLFLLCLASVTLSGCESTSGRSTAARKSGQSTTTHHRISNFRAVLRQASSDATFILVDEGHVLRKTREGRKRLALNSSQQAYKALTPENIDGLLTMFGEANAAIVQEPWVKGDEKLIAKPLSKQGGVRGVILVENNGQRYKLIGRRPQGAEDAIGRQKYMTFSKLKRIFFYWDTATSRAERADTALIGGASDKISPFDLKQKRN